MAQQAATPFRADPGDELPVGIQLGWRLRALIAAGRLVAGERMPSVRTMAGWAQVNVNTVRAVYARLEDEGMLVTRHGLGSFVAAGAQGSTEVERIAAEAIDAARAAGVDPRDVAITTLVSAALPEALDAGLPPELDEGDAEPDLAELAAELELDLDDSRLEVDEGAGAARAAPPDRPDRGRARKLQPRRRAPVRAAAAPPRRAPGRRRRRALGDSRRAALAARRGARGGRAARRARAPCARGARRDRRRPRRPSVGGRLGRGDRRARVHDLARGAADGAARRADELVAGEGLGRMPVSGAARGGER